VAVTNDEAQQQIHAELIADIDELEETIERLKDMHAAKLLELAGHIAKYGYTKVRE
jgi:hypothetical protein